MGVAQVPAQRRANGRDSKKDGVRLHSRHKVAPTPKQHTQPTTSDAVFEGVSDRPTDRPETVMTV